MQYVGHLDLHRSWERTLRRSGLPLEYSHGFHPQPHLNLACALPLGFTSQCEILDAWLEQELPLQEIHQAIEHALPPGLDLVHLEVVDEHTPSLQSQVISSVYLITLLDAVPDLSDRIAHILSVEHLPRIRREKPYDLRPLIEKADLVRPLDNDKDCIRVQMTARDSATGRPEEFLAELGIRFEDTRIHRAALILSTN